MQAANGGGRKDGPLDRITGIALPEKAYLPLCKWGVQLGSFQITRVEIRRFASYLEAKGIDGGILEITRRLGVLCPEWVTPLRVEFAQFVGDVLIPYLGRDIRAIARMRIDRERRLSHLKARIDRAKLDHPVGDDLLLEGDLLDLLQELDHLEKQVIE